MRMIPNRGRIKRRILGWASIANNKLTYTPGKLIARTKGKIQFYSPPDESQITGSCNFANVYFKSGAPPGFVFTQAIWNAYVIPDALAPHVAGAPAAGDLRVAIDAILNLHP